MIILDKPSVFCTNLVGGAKAFHVLSSIGFKKRGRLFLPIALLLLKLVCLVGGIGDF